ncbi:MAG: hypothetical protein R3322_00335 [Kiloniellales bacterium]|nr:hypothetical protein [Kiloniellales bacterium]
MRKNRATSRAPTRKASEGYPRDMGRAIHRYGVFQDRDAREIGVFHRSLQIPEAVVPLGPAVNVLYRSDKWNDGTHNYIHEFSNGVRAYKPIEGGEGRIKAVPRTFRSAKTLTLLGKCLGFTYLEGDDKIESHTKRPYPELYCVPSGRCLLVIHGKRKLLGMLWGGKMRIEARGIVD